MKNKLDTQTQRDAERGGCSPGTPEALRFAEKRAISLARRLGPFWVARVWANIGWHYATYFRGEGGRVNVHAERDGSFSAYLSTSDSSGGRWVGEGRTPKAAVINAIRLAEDERDRINGAVILARTSV